MLGMLIVSTLSPFRARGFYWQHLCQPSLLPDAWNANICRLLYPSWDWPSALRGILGEVRTATERGGGWIDTTCHSYLCDLGQVFPPL